MVCPSLQLKLSQVRENSVKEVMINYLGLCVAVCIYSVYVKCIYWEKSHTTVCCVSYSILNVRSFSFMNKSLKCHSGVFFVPFLYTSPEYCAWFYVPTYL